jgi:murein L,D-transpeptidase YcbB/YkuD
VKTLYCAALAALLSAAAPAAAETPNDPLHPAIATGLAIPIDGLGEARPAAHALPAVPQRGRFVLVDAASARLYMIEDGEIVDSMRVIVGKPGHATPTLRSTLFYATLNPYWNVPVDLARTLIAPNVLDKGLSYLKEQGYEVVTHFGEGAEVIDPKSVDWEAVADGSVKVRVRQRPGPANSMGEVKFGIPGGNGVFLHDTPMKDLFNEASRTFSSGCVRLEDAERFAEWLLGKDVAFDEAPPESHVPLPAAVPIVITYLPETQTLASLR